MAPPRFSIRPLTEADARAIAGWRHPGELAFYDLDRDPADLAELLDPGGWGREYFAADDEHGQLIGYLVLEPSEDAMEVGLGLRPDRIGMGLGEPFVRAVLRFATDALGARAFTLRVAAFNRRAITVYERAGFREVERYEQETNGGRHPFVRMARGPLAS